MGKAVNIEVDFAIAVPLIQSMHENLEGRFVILGGRATHDEHDCAQRVLVADLATVVVVPIA